MDTSCGGGRAVRLVTFSRGRTAPRVGAVIGPWNNWEWIVDLRAIDRSLPGEMLSFVDACGGLEGATWRRAQAAVDAAAKRSRRGAGAGLIRPKRARVHAPIAPRLLRDFIAFRGHIARTRAALGGPFPPEWDRLPAYYNGNHLSIFGPGDPVPVLRYPTFAGAAVTETAKLDYEAEVGFIVGSGGRNVLPGDAGRYLFGVTIFNDFSARDIQSTAMRIGLGPTPGKDWANALGPCIVTRDEFGPLADQRITVRVDGKERLRGTYRELVYRNPFVTEGERALWSFEDMVVLISHGQELHPGEVWGSGTIPGGCELEKADRAEYLRAGETVEIEIEGIGVLANPVVPAA